MSKSQVDYPLTADGELEVILQLDSPSVPPSGISGPPENYDPGCGPEWSVVGFRMYGITLPQKSVEELVMNLMQSDLSCKHGCDPSQQLLGHLSGAIDEAMENAEELEPDYPYYED